MDRGTERHTPPGPGRVPLAVVVVDRRGLVSHWSTGARKLFGVPKDEAIGQPALDLLPVAGALPDPDDTPEPAAYDVLAAYDGHGTPLGTELGYPSAGRARISVFGQGRADVLWWAYPLVGPGAERLLVLAADAAVLHDDAPEDRVSVERISPGFARHTEFDAADDLARRLPEILPSM